VTTTRKFLINGDADTPQPQTKQYTPQQIIGRTLSGAPVVQGYPSLQATWEKITRANMAKLASFYDPADPAVTITYTDPTTGADVTKAAMMEPIPVGNVIYAAFESVTVTFSHITATS
jgi:hypothetical protein